MGRVFVVELEGRVYKCKFCKTHLALADDLVSRAFSCRRGKAYLFTTAVNITVGPQEERMMLSGMHTVADIFCCCCGQIVGWKYVSSFETYNFDYLEITAIYCIKQKEQCTDYDHMFCIVCVCMKEAAHDKSQKYKEGKFVLERGRIVDGIDSEFNLDARYGGSDGEDA